MSLVTLSALAAYMLASDNLADCIESALASCNPMTYTDERAHARFLLVEYKKARAAYEALL